VFGLPLVHVVRGIDPSSGRRPTAVGIIAIGQVAVGIVAIGQVAIGGISLGQASIGLGWGIGQLAFGLLAAGQVSAGLLGAAGQLAFAPHALGMVTDTGLFVAMGWLVTGLMLAAASIRRRRRLRSLLDTPSPTRIASVRDGRAHVEAEVVSDDRLRAPLSSRPCVFWHTVHVGPRARARTQRRQRDDRRRSGRRASTSQRGHLHPQRQLPRDRGTDWALHIETSLARGETLHVAGPSR
jgi:hypothetical protein